MFRKYILKHQVVKRLLDQLEIKNIDRVRICTLSSFNNVTENSSYSYSRGGYDISRRLFAVVGDELVEAPTERFYQGSGCSYEPERESIKEGVTKEFLLENLKARFFVFVERVDADYDIHEPLGTFLTIVFNTREEGSRFLDKMKKEIEEEIAEIRHTL